MHLIGWLLLHHLVVFFLELWSSLSFGPFFFVPIHLFYSKGRSLRCSPGQGNPLPPPSLRWGAVCREGVQEGTMALAQLSASFQSLPPLPISKLGPSGADYQVCGPVHVLGPCWSLQWTLLWGWEFLLWPQPPQVFFSQRFWSFLFPRLEQWVVQSVPLPSCSFQFILTQMWDHPVCQPPPHPHGPPAATLPLVLPLYRSGRMLLL